MSEENVGPQNVEVVLEAYATFNAGEKTPQLRFWHEDGEYHVAREDPDTTIHRGIDALRRHYASWVEAYPDLEIHPREVQANGDQVFLWVHFSGHGAESDIPIEMELAHVLTVRDGKVARLVEYMDKAEALEAAGLSE